MDATSHAVSPGRRECAGPGIQKQAQSVSGFRVRSLHSRPGMTDSFGQASSFSRSISPPSSLKYRSLSLQGRRECRAFGSPTASCAKIESTRVSHRELRRKRSGIPRANGFTAYGALSLVSRACCHHPRSRCASIVTRLISASGYQDHALSPSVPAHSSRAPSRPPHPKPNVRDDRETPLRQSKGRAKKCP